MYGVVDVGSNTIKLVIYRVANGKIRSVLSQKYVAGLAGYVTDQGSLSNEGVAAAVAALSDIKNIAEQIGLRELFPFATASLRNIINQAEVLREIEKTCGLQIRVLNGEEEGRYDYYGAVQTMKSESGILVDVGGGSTEVVRYHHKKIEHAVSIPIGSLNLYNRFVGDILPSGEEIKSLQREVGKEISAVLPKNTGRVKTLCAVGGTARSLCKLARKAYGQKELDVYPAEYLQKILFLAENSRKKLTSGILKVSPDRIHTLLPGTVVINTVAQLYGSREIVTVPYGVREGYLYSVLEKRGLLYE